MTNHTESTVGANQESEESTSGNAQNCDESPGQTAQTTECENGTGHAEEYAETLCDGIEHFVSVRSVQVWKGGFSPEMVNDDGTINETAQDLEFHKEKSLSFECSCGERFHKWGTSAEHLRSVQSGPERGGVQD